MRHYLVRKLSGRTRTDRLVQFLARVWGDLLFQLETPIKVSETAYWRFVVVLGCIRFAINRHGGQIDIQEQVWHEGVLRFATTLEKYAIDLPLRLTGFWLKTYLVRWQEKIQDCLIDQADSEVFEKAVIVELQRSVRLSAHWRRVRHQLRDALGLDRELLRILKINQCIPYTLHPTYNRYAPQGVAIRRAIQENPHLAWLVFCTGNTSGRKMPSSSDPIAWVKEEIARAGVTNAAWRYLTRCRREDFLPILERPLQSRWGLLVNWLKVVGMLRRNDPVPVQILRWLYNTVRVSEGKLWFNGVRVQVGSLRSILGTAEQRLAANRLDEFMGGDLVDVLTWLKVVKPRLDPNQIRRGWAHLARQAAIWKEDVTMSEQNATRWVSLLPRTEIDGYQVTALTSFYQLWREGVSLRHCIGDAQYRRRCEEGAMCIFSISRADRKVATLSLACPDGAWVVHDIRGFANQAVGKPLAALGETVAASYNAMKKMNESSNAEQAVAPPMSTPGEEQ